MAGIYIVSDLGGSTFLASYGVSFFCLGNALSTPFGKPFIIRLSPVKLFLVCLLLMIVFSWQCATATSYFDFVLYRFLEGLASGPLYVLISVYFIPTVFTPEKQAKLLPYLFICFTFTPVLGASWGGWVAYTHHWRFLFFTNIPICLFLIILVSHYFRELDQPFHKSYLDKLGLFFYSISIIFIGSALIVGQQLDWFRSHLINMLLIVGGVSTVLFVIRSLNTTHPLIDLRLFKTFYFTFAIVNMGLLFAMYYGMVILLGLWLKLYVNYTFNWIALIIVTMAFGAWIPIFLDYQRLDPRLPLAVALIFLAASCFYTTTFSVDTNFTRIAFSRVLAGIGLAFFLPPIFRLSIQIFTKEEAAESVNCFHVIRLICSGLGAALFVTLWHHRQVFYYERLGGNLTSFSHATSMFFKKAAQFNLHGNKALAQLSHAVTRQATALALDDCFYLMAWIMVGLLFFLLLTFYPLKIRPHLNPQKAVKTV